MGRRRQPHRLTLGKPPWPSSAAERAPSRNGPGHGPPAGCCSAGRALQIRIVPHGTQAVRGAQAVQPSGETICVSGSRRRGGRGLRLNGLSRGGDAGVRALVILRRCDRLRVLDLRGDLVIFNGSGRLRRRSSVGRYRVNSAATGAGEVGSRRTAEPRPATKRRTRR